MLGTPGLGDDYIFQGQKGGKLTNQSLGKYGWYTTPETRRNPPILPGLDGEKPASRIPVSDKTLVLRLMR